jgi:hypothetical protein
MLAFTDEQLDILQRMAAPLAPPDRGRFLEAVNRLGRMVRNDGCLVRFLQDGALAAAAQSPS